MAEEEEGERKRKTAFNRQTPLNGVLRARGVRMVLTLEQVLELKRTFSMARLAYNWTVHEIKENGANPNKIALDKAFRATPRPEWATGKQAVSTDILKGAVFQACDAFLTNFKKRAKDPSHQFEVRYRSIRRTNT